MFDWERFWSFLLCFLGGMGCVVVITAACVAEDFLLFLWVVPCVVAMAAGFAVLD